MIPDQDRCGLRTCCPGVGFAGGRGRRRRALEPEAVGRGGVRVGIRPQQPFDVAGLLRPAHPGNPGPSSFRIGMPHELPHTAPNLNGEQRFVQVRRLAIVEGLQHAAGIHVMSERLSC